MRDRDPALDEDLPARAWVSGHGCLVVPRVPYEIARLPVDERIAVAHHRHDGVRQLLLAPGSSPSEAKVALGPSTDDIADVLAFSETIAFERGWQIHTRDYRCAFPANATAWSTHFDVSWPFELTLSRSPGGQMVYVQGLWDPGEAPSLDRLVGEGMRRSDGGELAGRSGRCEWLELQYTHKGESWVQRRYIVTVEPHAVGLVTAQALEPAAARTFAAAEEIACTLDWPDDDPSGSPG